jgi:hypothetical protein
MKTWEMIKELTEEKRRVFIMVAEKFYAPVVCKIIKIEEVDTVVLISGDIVKALTIDERSIDWEWREVRNNALEKSMSQKVIDFIKYLPEEYKWIAVDSQADGAKNFYAYMEEPYICEYGRFWSDGDEDEGGFFDLDEFKHILSELTYESSPYYIGDVERV